MCGFAGLLLLPGSGIPDLSATVRAMADALVHRGPDDGGTWMDAACGVGVGHRRLAIVDLSAAGHQPMLSTEGRFVIVFNGEIYNHSELRTELEAAGCAPAWRGHSDTETLLAAFEHWGLQATLEKSVGMFALAAWDRRDRKLHLARDRFGEKPLYYGWTGARGRRAFVFGSELKALRTYPGFANPVCTEALANYMRFAYVPTPRSIHQQIYKLEPGCMLSIEGSAPINAPAQPLRAPAAYDSLEIRRWWSFHEVVSTAMANPLTDPEEALGELESRLIRAVRLQSVADVPLGAFLSGGVDSSAIVALMQQTSPRRVRTFTVGFEESEFDESSHAQAVASHLGTEHVQLSVSAEKARAVIPHLATIYDEPFGDSSQIPTHLVCAAARGYVTVALSGDGGDEMFGGYNRYFWGPRIWARAKLLPYPVRSALAGVLTSLPPRLMDAAADPVNRLMGKRGVARAGEKLRKLGSSLRGAHSMRDVYMNLLSEWHDPAAVVRMEGAKPAVLLRSTFDGAAPSSWGATDPANMMFYDSLTYLPDDILCKVDRAAMAVSLETRVPFLDHRIAELTWRFPPTLKVRGGEGKWALRQVLYKHVPRELIDRPKSGFAIPVGQWLRGPLRSWAENLLAEDRLRREGYFHPRPIRKRWSEHLSGSRDHTASLWTVLMFQAWLESGVHA